MAFAMLSETFHTQSFGMTGRGHNLLVKSRINWVGIDIFLFYSLKWKY